MRRHICRQGPPEDNLRFGNASGLAESAGESAQIRDYLGVLRPVECFVNGDGAL